MFPTWSAIRSWSSTGGAAGVRRRLSRGHRLAGNPGYQGDRRRSIPLRHFAPLAEVPGVSLISLQKGPGCEQLAKIPGLAIDLGPTWTPRRAPSWTPPRS